MSISLIRSFSIPIFPTVIRISASKSLSTAVIPRISSRILLALISCIISRASCLSSGATRNTVSFKTSVNMPPRPNITQGPNWASRVSPTTSSRCPLIICCTRTAPSPAPFMAALISLNAMEASSSFLTSTRIRPASVL